MMEDKVGHSFGAPGWSSRMPDGFGDSQMEQATIAAAQRGEESRGRARAEETG
jgi:hypothetical protein